MVERPVAIVTGTSRGLGRALAAHLVARGFEVHGCSRSPTQLFEGYTHYLCDVGNETEVRDLVSSVRSAAGRLDVLVNNAGVSHAAMALLTPAQAVESTLKSNLTGTLLMCREGAKLMMKRKQGRIVNISSVAVPLNMEGASIYSAAKAGVEQFTRVFAREVAPLGITANVVSPSLVETDMMNALAPAALEKYLAALTIKRVATLEEVCHAVEFFIRPESAIVTGQVLHLGLAS